jgi:hypothetical protein
MHGKYTPDFDEVSTTMKIFTSVVQLHLPEALSDNITKCDQPYAPDYCRDKFYQIKSICIQRHISDLRHYTEVFKLIVPVLCSDDTSRLMMLCVHISRSDPSQGPYHGNFAGDFAEPTPELGDGRAELEERSARVLINSFYEITCERCIAAHRNQQCQNGTTFGRYQRLVHTLVDPVSSRNRNPNIENWLDLVLD